jgi:alanine dehydrogenase
VKIGIPAEIKVSESRVALVPAGARELAEDGHTVLLQSGAGAGVGLADADYVAAGASILPDAEAVFGAADLIVKVKEPQPQECQRLRRDHTLFTFLHLAADPCQADGLLASGATAIAYETVTAADGSLPLLTPMSEVAGRMSVQVGAHCLERHAGGSGILLGGVPGVEPGRVLILGGGVAGSNAAQMAVGLGADVTIVDLSLPRLRQLAERFGDRVKTVQSSREAISTLLREADLVVGAVLVPGDAAPKLVTRAMLREMKPGSVLVDIAIDQGGCFETSRPTTHEDPTFVVDDILHYCVANMPGAVARTSNFALCNATLPYVRALAKFGIEGALQRDPGLAAGVNVKAGAIVHPAVAAGLDRTRRLRLVA